MVKEVAGLKMYSLADVSQELGLTERTVRGWFMQGKLRGVKLGKEWFISETNLRKFLNAEDEGYAQGQPDVKKHFSKRGRKVTKEDVS